MPVRGERYSVVAFTHECRLSLTPKAMAESRALGYQPASREFLEAWSTNFLTSVVETSSPIVGRSEGAPEAPKQSGLQKWRSVDGIWTTERAEVTDGRLASVAESADGRLASVLRRPQNKQRVVK